LGKSAPKVRLPCGKRRSTASTSKCLNWFDAHVWAYAHEYGLSEIYSEDFHHDRHYGTVRVIDPFV
jgi:predicted nucleic acid-binding protein